MRCLHAAPVNRIAASHYKRCGRNCPWQKPGKRYVSAPVSRHFGSARTTEVSIWRSGTDQYFLSSRFFSSKSTCRPGGRNGLKKNATEMRLLDEFLHFCKISRKGPPGLQVEFVHSQKVPHFVDGTGSSDQRTVVRDPPPSNLHDSSTSK